jgi:hypothetical protein
MNVKELSKEKINKILETFLVKNKKNVSIQEVKQLPSDIQGIFSIKTSDNEKYVICIYDINASNQKALYWMDRYTYYGEIEEIFDDEYITVIIYRRGEKYNNEYIIKHYNRNTGYPLTELIPENEYHERLKSLKNLFLKVV